ncbi:AraC family transcriptional regulator [Algoriphagus sp.]|uniref:AraC family transcriptional regulator n=1 Tax=Algoriphagus sp. TaxID=1872435 RepID=UPI00327A58CC
MEELNLHIKNMVCPRCIKVVRDELTVLGAEVLQVEMGQARIRCFPSEIQISSISEILEKQGFELLEDENDMLLEKIRINLISYLIHIENNKEYESLSLYMSTKTGKNYCSISRHFSKYTNKTIEKYLIHLKIERVKELLEYNELTLSQIALKLRYNNVHYLSFQFKKVTGQSVTEYKKGNMKRRSWDKL